MQAIENVPKSLRWKLRARVGTSKIWYNEVEEVEQNTLEMITKSNKSNTPPP